MFVSEIFDECAEILGTTDETKVFRKITQAVQTLMESGHWTHTTAEIDICTGWDRQSLALPRGIDIPLAVNIDGSPTYFRNRLFQYHVNKGGMYNSVDWAWDDRGYVATLMDIVRPSQLIAVAESNNDVGKTIRVIGTNQNNRNLRSQTQNGIGVDGLLVPIHSQQDFAQGSIAPDGNTIATRDVAIDPITDFTTSTPHGLSSGQGMATRLISGTIPVPLNDGQTYYVGVIDAYTVQLFGDSLNAQALQYPIALQSIEGFGSMQLQDKRTAQVETSLKFVSTPTFTIDSPNEVVFPTQSLPAPLEAQKTYFAQPIDTDHIQIFSSLTDATNNTNPVYLTGSTSAIDVDVRKAITPETKLVFPVKHYFNDGDQVQAFTNGGTLPQPLVQNQNYFVNVIDGFAVSLHSNQADALSSSATNFVNPIKITTSGIGTNSLVKLIQATSTIGKTNQITAQGLNISIPSGSGAVFQAVVVGSVTSTRITSQGSGYDSDPGITFSAPPPAPSGSSFIPKPATGYAVRDTINNKILNIVILDGGFGYITAPSITIDAPSQQQIEITSITKAVGGIIATVTTSQNHGYSNGDNIIISGANEPDYNGTFVISGAATNTFTYTVPAALVSPATGASITSQKIGGSQAVATAQITTSFVSEFIKISGGSGYTEAPQVKITGIGTGATATATIASGSVTQLNIITTGSGYTITPSVTIEPSTGVFVNFSSTGSLPAPLISGTAYLAESPNIINQTFTVKNTDFSDVNITSSGTGTLYVVLSRAFRVDWTNNWLGDFTSLTTGQEIYFGTDYILPTTFPSIDNSVTPFYLNVASNTLARTYTSASSANGGLTANTIILSTLTSGGTTTATATTLTPHYLSAGQSVTIFGASIAGYNGTFTVLTSSTLSFTYTVVAGLGVPVGSITATTGLINIDSFGTGQTYYAIRTQAAPSVDTNLIKPASLAFITEGEIVQFSTSGTLPAPLVASTDYTIKLIGDSIRVYFQSNPVVLINAGIGQLSLDIIRNVTVQPSNNIIAKSSLYETTDKVVVRAKSNDVLPNGLSEDTNYYVRRLDNNSFELYDSAANAENTDKTIGRKEYFTSGNKITSTFFVDAIYCEVLVKSIAHIEKPLTDGYVSLYAWDQGRSNDMTLIGQYHPTEVNPQYRKIRLGKSCSWARIVYQVTAPKVSSIYDFIPLEQERAIIAAVHAVDLEDKDFADQAVRYWGIAYQYLRNQQESIDGHAMTPPQINNITYGDGTDYVMW